MPPTLAEVEAIARMAEPAARNLRITQCYHELSAALAAGTGPAANWCSFATWASKQAGQTIRGEDLPRALEAALRDALAPPARGEDPPELAAARAELQAATAALGAGPGAETLPEALWAALDPGAAAARAGEAVGRGNLKVFEEIGRAFARFEAELLGDPEPDPAKLDRFRASLRPGEPPEGQGLLRAAFGHYYAACFEPDAGRRAQALLLANLQIGLHEQTRLQPEIVAALEAGVVAPAELRRRLLASLFPGRSWLIRLRLAATRLLRGPTPLDRAAEAAAAVARQLARRAITEHLMSLALPGRPPLRLSEDLPARVPPALSRISLPELSELLARLDPSPGGPGGGGAADWADLGERLHYIADLFRAFADDPALLGPPFSAEQVAAIRAGRWPAGGL